MSTPHSIRASLNGLRAFEAAARLHSVSAAAAELHVTASAVSHQIRRLEERLGIQLFIRDAKQPGLTVEGEKYFRDISDAFERLNGATARLLATHERAVTVTTIPVFAIKWLVPRLAAFHARHPQVEVRVGTSYRLTDLNAGDSDLAIRWGDGNWPHVRSEKLLEDSVQPVCSPKLIGRRRLSDPMDVYRHPLIHMAFARDDWALWSAAQGLRPPPATAKHLRFNDPSSALQAAIDGLGFALGPMSIVHDDISSGRLITPLHTPIGLREAYYLVEPERGRPNSNVALFRTWLLEASKAFSKTIRPATYTLGAVDVSRDARD